MHTFVIYCTFKDIVFNPCVILLLFIYYYYFFNFKQFVPEVSKKGKKNCDCERRGCVYVDFALVSFEKLLFKKSLNFACCNLIFPL